MATEGGIENVLTALGNNPWALRAVGGGVQPPGAPGPNDALARALSGIVTPRLGRPVGQVTPIARMAPPPRYGDPEARQGDSLRPAMGAPMTSLPGATGGGRDLGGGAIAAGLGKIGQALDQGLGDLAAKQQRDKEMAASKSGMATPHTSATGGTGGAGSGPGSGGTTPGSYNNPPLRPISPAAGGPPEFAHPNSGAVSPTGTIGTIGTGGAGGSLPTFARGAPGRPTTDTAGNTSPYAPGGPITPEDHPDRYGGRLGVGGARFSFVTGGAGRGSSPPGDHLITGYRTDGAFANRGGAFTVADVYDPKVGGAPRSAVEIHDMQHQGTAGCFGVPHDQWPAASAAIKTALDQSGGTAVLRVDASGNASILSPATASAHPIASTAPADNTALTSGDFAKAVPGTATAANTPPPVSTAGYLSQPGYGGVATADRSGTTPPATAKRRHSIISLHTAGLPMPRTQWSPPFPGKAARA